MMMKKVAQITGLVALALSLGSASAIADEQTGMSGMAGMDGMAGMAGMEGMSGMDGMAGMSGDHPTTDLIDTWGEAHKVANAWLGVSGMSTYLATGKIRKINRLYVISIVDKKPPHNLKNQLIIRATDGFTLPMF